MTKAVFVTGTDTEIGKTLVCVQLIRALVGRGHRVAGMKPVASGCVRTPSGLRSEDALKLIAAANVDVRYEEVNPYAFEPPIAPHIASREAGVRIELPQITSAFQGLRARTDWVVVEGVGGWLVPLSGDRTVADLAAALDIPVVLVVGIRLGCINHALLSARAIRGGGAVLRAWVANRCVPAAERATENIGTLDAMIGVPCLATIPFMQPGIEAPVDLDLTALGEPG